MKNTLTLICILLASVSGIAQNIDSIINPREVERVEKTLSSDDMQGRASFTPGLERAAEFISAEFRAAGLQPLPGDEGFRQTLTMVKTKTLSTKGQWNGIELDPKNIIALSSAAQVDLNEQSRYEKKIIHAGDNFRAEVFKYIHPDRNYLLLVDTSFSKLFPRLNSLKGQQFRSDYNVIFLLTPTDASKYSIQIRQEIAESKLSNLVGILPGTSRKNEYVIFSAHYDHLGIGKPNAQQDSIYNGANDDASGSTAVILLAKYFAAQKVRERTLVFATFAAEEIGGFGSQYFSRQFDPAQIVAMFNIEMIGTESKWGTRSAYITGYERTDMGKILQKNLAGTEFTFYPDPYPSQQLFFRSDNATLAMLGVPAHSISTSKMDAEKYYHTQDDEIETLDMKNMTEIIKAIALSSGSIVSGKDSPTRVDTSNLK